MRLFLEPTSKAIGQVNTAGVETKHEDRDVEEQEDSYARRPVGVASGHEADPDDPDVGKQWRDGETQGDAVRQVRDSNKKNAVKDGMISKKSFSDEASDLLKSVTATVQEDIRKSMPNDAEVDFLVDVMGRDRSEVLKGLHWISGRDRDLFNDWVCDRMTKSIDALIRRVP